MVLKEQTTKTLRKLAMVLSILALIPPIVAIIVSFTTDISAIYLFIFYIPSIVMYTISFSIILVIGYIFKKHWEDELREEFIRNKRFLSQLKAQIDKDMNSQDPEKLN